MSATTTAAPVPAASPARDLADDHIGLRGHLRHTGALMRRNLLWIRQDPESMFDAVLMPIVFTLLFVYVFGGSIGMALGGGREEYVQYLVPGMLAMMALSMSMSVGTGFNQDIEKGVMDRFRSLPIGRGSVLFAKIAVEQLRVLISTVILLLVSLLVGFEIDRPLGLLAAVGLSMLFGISLMWVFLALGVTAKSAQSVQALGFLVMMPLQFGSSLFAPTSSMPGWLEAFADWNPLSCLADASRGLMVGGPVARDLWVTLGWTALLTAVMAPYAIRKFTTRD
ncbi:ABC transporter permease [Streptomyces sp. NPDC002734]|uniref:ABC transporter permease n=1 Tax=Streptomyces sp. NPDC002734 TaxID=3154426 RepID=UPI00332DD323